jgi:hypothetical protein
MVMDTQDRIAHRNPGLQRVRFRRPKETSYGCHLDIRLGNPPHCDFIAFVYCDVIRAVFLVTRRDTPLPLLRYT